jgi:hypothetical protein
VPLAESIKMPFVFFHLPFRPFPFNAKGVEWLAWDALLIVCVAVTIT